MFSDKERISLVKMASGESGVVVEVLGGHGALRRLEALGIRVGKKITKISESFLWGPVTVRSGGTQVSIGHGLASKIMVEEKE